MRRHNNITKESDTRIHFGPRLSLFSDCAGSTCDWIWLDGSSTGYLHVHHRQQMGIVKKSTRGVHNTATDRRRIPTAWSKPLGLAVQPTDVDDRLPLTLQQHTESLVGVDALVEMGENRGQIRGRLGVYLTLVRGSVCHGARQDYHGIIMVIEIP